MFPVLSSDGREVKRDKKRRYTADRVCIDGGMDNGANIHF
jgi:hypothetical protein